LLTIPWKAAYYIDRNAKLSDIKGYQLLYVLTSQVYITKLKIKAHFQNIGHNYFK